VTETGSPSGTRSSNDHDCVGSDGQRSARLLQPVLALDPSAVIDGRIAAVLDV
jgi:uncharacterized protein YacL